MPTTSTSSRITAIFTITIFCSMFVVSLFFLHIRNQMNLLQVQLASHSDLPVAPVEYFTQDWPVYTNTAQNFSIRISPSLAQSDNQPQIITATNADFWLSWKNDLVALDIIIDSRQTKTESDLLASCFGSQKFKIDIQKRSAVSCGSKFINQTRTGASLNYYILDGNRLIRLWATSQDVDKMSLVDLDQILSSFQFIN